MPASTVRFNAAPAALSRPPERRLATRVFRAVQGASGVKAGNQLPLDLAAVEVSNTADVIAERSHQKMAMALLEEELEQRPGATATFTPLATTKARLKRRWPQRRSMATRSMR